MKDSHVSSPDTDTYLTFRNSFLLTTQDVSIFEFCSILKKSRIVLSDRTAINAYRFGLV